MDQVEPLALTRLTTVGESERIRNSWFESVDRPVARRLSHTGALGRRETMAKKAAKKKAAPAKKATKKAAKKK